MRQGKLYELIASATGARLNCLAEEKRTGKEHEWTAKHEDTIDTLIRDFMPSGSGIDNGTKFDFDASTGEKLVFTFGYHHMDENGMYNGWTKHTLTVKPSLVHGITLSISGSNRNDIKEYLHQEYDGALTELIEWDDMEKRYFSPSLRTAQEAFKKTQE